MPITKSAQKALRQNTKRRNKNRQVKKRIKKILKEIKVLISQKKIQEAKKLLPLTYKSLDKAAKIGLIKKNTAARKKARTTKLIDRSVSGD